MTVLTTTLAVLWLVACGDHDPELTSQRRATEAWRAGEASMGRGDYESAVAAFERASKERPADVLLEAWRASAQAGAGDLDGAVHTLDNVLLEAPGFVTARYNRAAYLARSGQVEEAAEVVRGLIRDGDLRAHDVFQDEDFAAHRAHPALAFLPREALEVVLEGSSETAFWGSEVDLTLLVVGEDGPVTVRVEHAEGPVEVVRTVEEVVASTAGPSVRLRWTLRVNGHGPVIIGPMHVQYEGRDARTEPFHLEAIAPVDKRTATERSAIRLEVPRRLGGEEPAPVAWVDDLHLYLKRGPRDRAKVDGLGVPEQFELRDGRELVWVLERFARPLEPVAVTILRGRTVVFEAHMP